MNVLVPTIPHCGSTFIVELLRKHGFYQIPGVLTDLPASVDKMRFEHTYPGDARALAYQINSGEFDLAVIPVRHPIQVVTSWRRRGRGIIRYSSRPLASRKAAPLQMCVDEMGRFLGAVSPGKVFTIAIDRPTRAVQLDQLSRRLGRHLETDWAPRGEHPHNRTGVEIADEEWTYAQHMCGRQPFVQFGYELEL